MPPENNRDGNALTAAKTPFISDEDSSSTAEIRHGFNEFRLYQFVLFLLTQAGYFAVAGTMLHTTFLEPSKNACNILARAANISDSFDELNRERSLKGEFYSLAIEWNEECGKQTGIHSLAITAPNALMIGTIFGSFGAGLLADQFGRKPIVINCLLVLCLTNVFISLVGASRLFHNDLEKLDGWRLSPDVRFTLVLVSIFVSGAACGGYMVTNIVFLVEAFHNSAKLRLLVVSLNGWPLGIIFAALVGAFSEHWRLYHLIVALVAISVLALFEVFSLESLQWHLYRGNRHLAVKVQQKMQKRYSNSKLTTAEEQPMDCLADAIKTSHNKAESFQTYSYFDLFKYSSIWNPLFKLSYCFFSSSVVSYGLFFSVGALPGNRYVNLGIMGAGKFALGITSFLVSFRVGRRTIMIVSLGISCLVCWALLVALEKERSIESVSLNSTTMEKAERNTAHYVTYLALLLTAMLDPSWKMNHLLSTELFPIQVRNMSRGLCNMVGRIGSIAGPLMVNLRMIDIRLPFWIYSVLLTFQCVIAFTFPETRDQPLINKMPDKANNQT